MRTLAAVLVASLLSACAPAHVGAWRADGAAATATDPAARVPEPSGVRYDDDRDHDRFDDSDEVIGCLGQAAVIGGIAAVIYLTRFRRGGGGGGDGEPGAARPADARVSPEAAAIVEADLAADGTFRPCGAICGEPGPGAP